MFRHLTPEVPEPYGGHRVLVFESRVWRTTREGQVTGGVELETWHGPHVEKKKKSITVKSYKIVLLWCLLHLYSRGFMKQSSLTLLNW